MDNAAPPNIGPSACLEKPNAPVRYRAHPAARRIADPGLKRTAACMHACIACTHRGRHPPAPSRPPSAQRPGMRSPAAGSPGPGAGGGRRRHCLWRWGQRLCMHLVAARPRWTASSAVAAACTTPHRTASHACTGAYMHTCTHAHVRTCTHAYLQLFGISSLAAAGRHVLRDARRPLHGYACMDGAFTAGSETQRCVGPTHPPISQQRTAVVAH